MTFIECINRIFRQNAIIRGDTDTIETFDDTQHNASMHVAIVGVQDELIKLVAERLLPKERNTSGTVLFATDTRVYSLASDFIRFFGVPHFYRSDENRQIYEYQGGLEQLQIDIYDYDTQGGDPNWWYWEPSSASLKQVGFYQVPTSAESGETWTYDYEASVMVDAATDDLPFHNDEESFSFTLMASRRFKFMFEDVNNSADIEMVLERDWTYRTARATLYKLLRGQNAATRYAPIYV